MHPPAQDTGQLRLTSIATTNVNTHNGSHKRQASEKKKQSFQTVPIYFGGIGVRVTECRSASALLPTVLVRSSMCWIEADVSVVGVRSCGAVVPAVGDAFLAAAPILTSDCCRSSDGSGIG